MGQCDPLRIFYMLLFSRWKNSTTKLKCSSQSKTLANFPQEFEFVAITMGLIEGKISTLADRNVHIKLAWEFVDIKIDIYQLIDLSKQTCIQQHTHVISNFESGW